MFSSFAQDHPYARMHDLAEAQEVAIKGAVRLFDKNRHGFKIITRIAKGEMLVDEGIRDIKNMLCVYADKINNESD